MHVPPLETERLWVRPFAMEDLEPIHQILDVELAAADFGSEGVKTLAERRRWLQWTVWGYDELALLYQPPYGDRAIVLRASQELIGACGFVPCLGPFGQIPTLQLPGPPAEQRLSAPEVGLYYAITPRHQRHGYATEAAQALVRYAFAELRLRRLIATTTYGNDASIRVMRKLGMHIATNGYPTPPWLQVVGVVRNPSRHAPSPDSPAC
jgi:ribosomal-protein-alanine N-acetyltransferase